MEHTTEAIVSENISTEKVSAKEEVYNENSGNVLVRRKSSRRKRVFQKFWCATEEDEDLIELPRPDEYRLKSHEKGGSQKRKKRMKHHGIHFLFFGFFSYSVTFSTKVIFHS